MSDVAPKDYSDISQVSRPRLSPEGKAVAFLKRDPKTDDAYEQTVYLVPADGGPKRQFTLAEDMETAVEWSPDGDRLAFVSNRSGSSELWVVPTDGGEGRQITTVVGDVRSIAWHPGGERVAFVTGGSFGGFMTSWIVGHTDLFTAAVAQRGVYDQLTQCGSKDFFHSTEWHHGDSLADREQYWENSQVAYADQVETPTLLVHSERDFRVPVHNAELFYRLLKLNGVETELVRYPRGTHELSRSGEPASVCDRLERIVEWFDRHSQ